MRTVLIETEYDGSGFHGWQAQPETRTVQGDLEAALSKVCGEPIRVSGTSRTDAGVHAYGQTASFTGDFGIPTERIPIAANNLLTDIRIKRAEEKPQGFHARYDAVGKTYLYRIRVGETPDIFLRNYRYLLNKKPNTSNMREAASHFIGKHDFRAFMSSGGTRPKTTERTVFALDISESQTELSVRITGDGFLYNMVRIVVGTLVEVGLGVGKPENARKIIASGARSEAGHTAPPSGLYLERVYFSKAEMAELTANEV
ncbi:MAG: tRNA pseudouridine(38-40) synthase TruA [Clostridiales Family XIII bacterium]|jgi:tRNA pseudouridine38-40 synthase|nr:tRNA pseudouridine(38-40) synthase TruA [Clostridiales Family XIII bacterium]